MAQQNNLKIDNIHQIDPDWVLRWLVEERDACGVGFIADVRGSGSHQLIEQALFALGCLEHWEAGVPIRILVTVPV
jgi:glutamate synthase (ferredoxin)